MLRSFLVLGRQRFLARYLLVSALVLGGAGCGGGGSTTHTTNPVPQIASLSPNSTTVGEAAFTLIVTGTGFISGSVVRWNGASRPTNVDSSTQLTASIPATDIATPGTAQVTVFNPSPGGGTSPAQAFTINPVSPTAVVIDQVSVASDGTQGNFDSFDSVISADGRFVAFDSRASNLVASDTNGTRDVFVHDTCLGAPAGCTPSTVRVSVAADGSQGNGISQVPSISANGRFVAFLADASNLVAGDTNGANDVFVRDTCVEAPAGCSPSTIRVSVASDGSEANGGGNSPTPISADGRFVAFDSQASNLVAGDTNGTFDVFLRDTCLGVPTGCIPSTTRVSVASDGTQGNGSSEFQPSSISADGRFVAFSSDATNLVPGDTNAARDVFVRDTCFGATGCVPSTIRVSVASDGSQAIGGSLGSVFPSISGDGRFVAFSSDATNLVAGDTNATPDVFVHDTCIGASGCTPSTIRVSVASDGTQGNGISDQPSISAAGRFVAFGSDANNLVAGDTNGARDAFLRDTCSGAPAGCTPSTIRISMASDGSQANNSSITGALSADGGFVAIDSNASNLVAGDTNGFIDVFLARTGFAAATTIATTSPAPGTMLTSTEPTSEGFSRLAPFLWSLLLLAFVGQLTKGGDGTYRGQFIWPTRAKPISLPLVKLFSLYRIGPAVHGAKWSQIRTSVGRALVCLRGGPGGEGRIRTLVEGFPRRV